VSCWLSSCTRFLLLTAVLAGSAANSAIARRAIPDDNLAYPVLITLNNGDFGSGFYLKMGMEFYLVTARHVLIDPATKKLRHAAFDPTTHNMPDTVAELLSYSSDVSDLEPNEIKINLSAFDNSGDLKVHPTQDVIAIRIGTGGGTGAEPFTLLSGVTTIRKAKAGLAYATLDTVKNFDGALTGNDVIMFGYPNSLGLQPNSQFDSRRPLLRKGIIAGKNLETKSLILDCPSYQGNSGGPVLQIETDDKNFLTTHFQIIGIVREFIPYANIWLNERERYTNTTILNSGYSIATPMDFVLELTK
jgi:Trypsin-like peptidase domain